MANMMRRGFLIAKHHCGSSCSKSSSSSLNIPIFSLGIRNVTSASSIVRSHSLFPRLLSSVQQRRELTYLTAGLRTSQVIRQSLCRSYTSGSYLDEIDKKRYDERSDSDDYLDFEEERFERNRIRRPIRDERSWQSQHQGYDSYSNRRQGNNMRDSRDTWDRGMRDSRDMKDFQLKTKTWGSNELNPVEKNFYVEHESVAAMPQSEVDEFYATNNITISKGEKIRPLSDFHHANLPDVVNAYMEKLEWSKPTPIQSLGWPVALSGKNMVGVAQTGSGKTLGFILPALIHIKHQRQVMRGEGPIVLIMAPTRELAQQISTVARDYGRLLGVRSCAIFGGQSKNTQARLLYQSPEIVVATPGRLLDFLESEVINLDRTTFTVLDEADRMLDMGFEPQMRKVLSQIRPDRQLLMWSATWPKEIQQLARDFLVDFTQVNIGSGSLVANENIEQVIKVCERREKMSLLVNELEAEEKQKTLIFVQTKRMADQVTQALRNKRFRALAIHGDKAQQMRDRTLHSFRNGETQILVATDVASRGLDVDDIKLVVNYDYPNTADDYIHRIGRTGRASKTGKSITFMTDEEADRAKDLIHVLRDSKQPVPIELRELADISHKLKFQKKRSRFSGNRGQQNFRNNNRGFFDDDRDWR